MKLDLYDIQSIANGAARVTCENGYFNFYRFTLEQEQLYKERSADFYNKTFSTSGITLRFKTDSTQLFLDVLTEPGTSRSYYAFDVAVDGKRIASLDNYSSVDIPKAYTGIQCPLGPVSGTFELGNGDKEVTVYFPWSVNAKLKEISLNGTYFKPVKYSKKLLAFGDSITHGYDALHPSNKYVTRIAEALDAQEYNKAIGGEIFFPDLASSREDFEPDYVTVAYGTNDWSKCDRDTFVSNMTAFYTALSATYPKAQIFALTPIWRKESETAEKAYPFNEIPDMIEKACSPLENVTVCYGFDLVDHKEDCFADLRLHPNDEGFGLYFERLIEIIRREIK